MFGCVLVFCCVFAFFWKWWWSLSLRWLCRVRFQDVCAWLLKLKWGGLMVEGVEHTWKLLLVVLDRCMGGQTTRIPGTYSFHASHQWWCAGLGMTLLYVRKSTVTVVTVPLSFCCCRRHFSPEDASPKTHWDTGVRDSDLIKVRDKSSAQ